ncbi:hypothetical protein VaNZ11_014141 [Volvox africanus]|uniref:PHD-type domain-containing protein n=1 Tax=Volvox africanus TaxID=51714 RepID=A0ABQ5SHT4_9CHLO|nr:hypothetical protein VaNZ11_014141 [Volvox africanus]
MNAPPQWALCAFCGQDRKAYSGSLGAFLGPLDDGNRSGVGVYVHRDCALWSSEVYHSSDGTKLRKVGQAIRRGRQLRCGHCGERGASLGCRLERCNVSYHLPCARASGCAFFTNRFLIACPRHMAEFKHELPPEGRGQEQGRGPGDKGGAATRRPSPCPWLLRISFGGHLRRQAAHEGPDLRQSNPSPIRPTARHLQGHTQPCRGGGGAEFNGQQDQRAGAGGLPSKRRKIDHDAVARHMAVAHAALASARCATAAAAAAAATEVDDDEAVFAVKERRRHAKDIGKLAPVILGRRAAAGGSDNGDGGGRGLYSRGFECVGGLQAVIQSLREMVLLPLLHPGLLEKLGVAGAAPPRGILLHGLPGTGKTLVVRALAGEVARTSPVPVALFARGGADVLGKYHGDAERTLRLLFEEARRRAPSIIFLDELDALAPRRSISAGGADQIYASVVATLLALMDGVADRGQVVVIGATNRPDNLDPALRRPGRFDREVAMGLPSREDRAAVLRVHTVGWRPQPSEDTIERIAEATEGFAGADLAALCCSAVMAALRRTAVSAAATAATALVSPEPASEDVVEFLLHTREREHQAEGVRQCAQQTHGPTQQQQQQQQRKSQQPECGDQVGAPGLPKARAGELPVGRLDAAKEEVAPVGTEGPASVMAAHGGAPTASAPSDIEQLNCRARSSDGRDVCMVSEKEGDMNSDREVQGKGSTATGYGFDSQLRPPVVAVSMPVADGRLSEPVRCKVQAAGSHGRRTNHSPVLAQAVCKRFQEAADVEQNSANVEGVGGNRSSAEVGTGHHTAAISGGAATLPRQKKSFVSILRCVGEMFDGRTMPVKNADAQDAMATDVVMMKPQTTAEAVSSAAAIRTTAARADANTGVTKDVVPAATEAHDYRSHDVDATATRQLTMNPAEWRGWERAVDGGPDQAAAGVAGIAEGATTFCSPTSADDMDLEAARTIAAATAEPQRRSAQTCFARNPQQVQGPAVHMTDLGGNGSSATPLDGRNHAHQAGAAVLGQIGSRNDLHADGETLKGGRDAKEGSEAEGKENDRQDPIDDLLAGVRVEDADWELALAAAPQPCSRRDAAAVVNAAGPPPAPPAHTAALVAPAVAVALLWLMSTGIAVPEPILATATAVVAATSWQPDAGPAAGSVVESAMGSSDTSDPFSVITAFLRLLISVGAVEGPAPATPNHDNVDYGSHAAVGNGPKGNVPGVTGAAPTLVELSHAGSGHTALGGSARLPRVLHHQPFSLPHTQPQLSACHLLLCGRGDMGQDAVAALVLRLLSAPHSLPRQSPQQPPGGHQPLRNAGPFGLLGSSGAAAVHTISLPAIVLRAGGGDCIEDTAAGVSSLASEALSPTHGSHGQLQVLYLPCIDTWALEQRIQINKDWDSDDGDADAATEPEIQGCEDAIGDEAEIDGDEADAMAAAAVAAGAARDSGRCDLTIRAGKSQKPQQQQQHWLEDAELPHADDDDKDDDDAIEAEATLRSRTCISPAWSVFMQQVSAASIALGRPNLNRELRGPSGFLVLATCAVPPDQLPPEILEFFGTQQSQGQPERAEAAATAAAMTGWAAGASWPVGGTKPYGVQQSRPTCRQTLTLLPPLRAAVEAAEAAAEAAVLPTIRRVLENCVLQALRDAATVTHDTAADDCVSGGEVGGHKPVARVAPAGVGRTQHLEAAGSLEQGGRCGINNMESGFLSPIDGSVSLSLNATELERGRRLCRQVKIAIRCIASSMLRRGSGCHLAQAIVVQQLSCGNGATAPSSRAILGAADIANGESHLKGDVVELRLCGGGSDCRATRGQATEVVSLLDVAQRAMEGRIHTLEKFREEVQCAAALIRALRNGSAARPHQPGVRHIRPWPGAASRLQRFGGASGSNCVGYSRAVAAASMWEDAVVAACEAASRSLQLDKPENRRLMEIALACYMNGQYNGSVGTAAAAASPGTCRYSAKERAGLGLPLNAALTATGHADVSASLLPGLGSSEQGSLGTAPFGQQAGRPRDNSIAAFNYVALRGAGGDGPAAGGAVAGEAAPSDASRHGTAAAAEATLERLAAALVARVCTLLAHQGGLRRLLREGARGDVAGELYPAEEPSRIYSVCAQPCAADRSCKQEENNLLSSGEGAGLVSMGRGMRERETESECNVAALVSEQVRQVTVKILAICECACRNHSAGKEPEARGTGNAYARWVHSVIAQAFVNVVSVDMREGEAELLAAAADQLVAVIKAAAV